MAGNIEARTRWEDRTAWPLMAESFLFLVVYSLSILATPLPAAVAVVFAVVLILIWASFLIDYVVRLVWSPDRWAFVSHNLIDLASVLIPLARPFRLIRYLPRLPLLGGHTGSALRRRVVVTALCFVVLFIYVIALAEYKVEHDVPGALITTFGDSVWWACVTMATVGYGDYYPITVPGRILAVILMVGGIAIVGTASATFVSLLSERMSRHPREEGHLPTPPQAPQLDLTDDGDAAEQQDADR